MYNRESDIAEICDKTPYPEQLTMLAEECTELAQAALKLRRTIVPGASPTNISRDKAYSNLNEECADVLTCMLVLGDYIRYIEPAQAINDVIDYKVARWRERLVEGNK